MPAPFLVSARGVSGGTSKSAATEIWSFGTWWAPTSGTYTDDITQVQMNTCANACYEALKTLIGSSAGSFQANIGATESRVYKYDGDPSQPVSLVGYSGSDNGQFGISGNALPLQASIVCSFYTEGREKPRYGRIYLPTQSYPLGEDGRLGATAAANIFPAVKAYLGTVDGAIAQLIGQDSELVVQSRTAPYPYKPVTELRIGRVVDTQRRRRNKLVEAPTITPYP